MRRLLSLATALTLTSAALSIPTTALADVTGLQVGTSFDRLAPDRIATINVSARSTSGVKSVRAELHHRGMQTPPYATLTDFTLTRGTVNDGSWRTTYRPDTETRSGQTYVRIVVESESGGTQTRTSGFFDCYETTFADFASEPQVIDIDHTDLTATGRLVTRKSREEAPQPVAGANVRLERDAAQQTVTRQDGTFELKVHDQSAPLVISPAVGPRCQAAKWISVTVQPQEVVLSAKPTNTQPVLPGTPMTVEGRALRRSATGLVPVPGQPVDIGFRGAIGGSRLLGQATTSADGAFRFTFTAQERGTLSVSTAGTVFLKAGSAAAGTADVRAKTTITGFNAGPEPVSVDDVISVTGWLLANGQGIGAVPVDLEFSVNGKTGWTRLQSRITSNTGKIELWSEAVRDGYWRVRYAGGPNFMPTLTGADHVDVRDRTYMYNFNAAPEPVRKGGTVTVVGDLYRMTPKVGRFPGQKIAFYFLPKGSTKWTYLGGATTDRKGHFRKGFKASRDGTWRAYYAGDATLLKWYSQDYVDVR